MTIELIRDSRPTPPVPTCLAHPGPYVAWTVPEAANSFTSVPVVATPLPSGGPAVVPYAAYERIMRTGFSANFFVHYNNKSKGGKSYVATSHPDFTGKVFSVSRLVMEAPRGSNVRFKTQDRRNLLATNLKLGAGYSKGLEAAAVKFSENVW